MKPRNLLSLIIIFAVITTSLTAKIWRVDNNGGSPGAFTTLQAAHDGANSGDTLYVYGSPINYGHLSLSKALTIIGPGYYLNENPETQAYPATASANTITFNNFSSGSLLTGLWTDHINVNTDSITLKRLRIHSGYHEGSINLSQYVDVVTIQQ